MLNQTIVPTSLKHQVIYNGIQEGFGNIPARYTFTDRKTKSTFLIDLDTPDLFQDISTKLNTLFQNFYN